MGSDADIRDAGCSIGGRRTSGGRAAASDADKTYAIDGTQCANVCETKRVDCMPVGCTHDWASVPE